MEHRRKQVTAMGVEIVGEVLAQVWDEKVLVIFDNEVGKVQSGGEVGWGVWNVPNNIARGFISITHTCASFGWAAVEQR